MPDDSKVILLVEDNADDEALTLRAFAKNNISRHGSWWSATAAEALAWLFKRDQHQGRTEPDPQLDPAGPEACRNSMASKCCVKYAADPRTTALIPVVILTSSKDETGPRSRGYELRANSYIRKPVEFARFVDVVRELGLYWLVLNEPPPAPPKR